MKYLKVFFVLFLLFILYIFLSAKSYSLFLAEDLSEEIFRLHIIANSDSTEDQYLKLQIRDNILNYINSFSSINSSKKDIISTINNNRKEIENIIKDTITKNGYNYSFTFDIENCYFPTKNYGDITLPNGNYDCLNIKIGNSSGENWWCVMFPPVCLNSSSIILDTSSSNILNNNLNSESYNIISSNKKTYKIKFKILEIFNSL